MRPGRAHPPPTPQPMSGKGRSVAGPRGEAGGAGGSGRRGCAPQDSRSRIPAAQAPSRGAGDTAQDPALPPGQTEAGRAQDGEDAPATKRPRAVQLSARPREHPGQCGLGDCGWLLRELTPGLGTWPPPVVFLPVSPCAWDGAGRQGTGPHGVNSSQQRGWGEHLPQVRTPENQHSSCSPRRPAGEQGKSKFLTEQRWKLQGKLRDLQFIEPEGSLPFLSFLFPVKLVFISDCKYPIFFLFSHLNYNILPPLHF